MAHIKAIIQQKDVVKPTIKALTKPLSFDLLLLTNGLMSLAHDQKVCQSTESTLAVITSQATSDGRLSQSNVETEIAM
jgi:hypothetical protein